MVRQEGACGLSAANSRHRLGWSGALVIAAAREGGPLDRHHSLRSPRPAQQPRAVANMSGVASNRRQARRQEASDHRGGWAALCPDDGSSRSCGS